MTVLDYFRSLSGRLFLILLVGVVASACLALGLANMRRLSDLDRINLDRIEERVTDFVTVLERAPPTLRAEMISAGFPGLYVSKGFETILGMDYELTRRLAVRLVPEVQAMNATPSTCLPYAPSRAFHAQIMCWVVYVKLAENETLKIMTFSPRTDTFNMSPPDAVFLSILTLGAVLLTFFVSRMATSPLRDLSHAAEMLGRDPNGSPLPERGPTEVRAAIFAFNAMRTEINNHIAQRTRILASITHDLQTPLTRLRLRLEKIKDPALRSRLIDDFASMQALIRQGLQFYRGNEVQEPFMIIQLDSLLETIVADAADGGGDIALIHTPDCDIRAKPEALRRCLANLVDNGLKYGSRVDLAATAVGESVRISIRDFGPGIPNDKLEKVFEPFVRLENAAFSGADGVGLGLAIARTLARENNAVLDLRNHPDGGLEVTVTLKCCIPERDPDGGQASRIDHLELTQ